MRIPASCTARWTRVRSGPGACGARRRTATPGCRSRAAAPSRATRRWSREVVLAVSSWVPGLSSAQPAPPPARPPQEATWTTPSMRWRTPTGHPPRPCSAWRLRDTGRGPTVETAATRATRQCLTARATRATKSWCRTLALAAARTTKPFQVSRTRGFMWYTVVNVVVRWR